MSLAVWCDYKKNLMSTVYYNPDINLVTKYENVCFPIKGKEYAFKFKCTILILLFEGSGKEE